MWVCRFTRLESLPQTSGQFSVSNPLPCNTDATDVLRHVQPDLIAGEFTMMRSKIISVAGAVAFFIGFSTPVFAQEPTATVAGRWEITVEAQPAAVLTLEQEGADLAGILSGDQGDLEVTGEVDGNEVIFSTSFDAQGFPITIYFVATVVEENDTLTMAGSLEVPDFPEFPAVNFRAVKIESLSTPHRRISDNAR